jgi:lipid-binding SYLF domain-containing protein
MKTHQIIACAITAVALSLGLSRAVLADTVTEGQDTLAVFLKADPDLKRFVDGAAGYAVFPKVAKGAVGVGGAHGSGVLFGRGGTPLGTAKLNQVSVGLALGGQTFSEVIFFETPKALNEFQKGDFAMTAQVSAVALARGAARAAKYASGVAVFTATTSGLMFEASLGGQKFKVKPLEAGTSD